MYAAQERNVRIKLNTEATTTNNDQSDDVKKGYNKITLCLIDHVYNI